MHYSFFGFSQIRKTKVNDSLKVYSILNLELETIQENSKGTETLKQNFILKKASQHFNTKKRAHTYFFLGHSQICKTQVNISTKICTILELEEIRENSNGTGTLLTKLHSQKGKSTIQH